MPLLSKLAGAVGFMSERLVEVAEHPAMSANRPVAFQFDYLVANWAETNCFGVFSSLHVFC